MEEIVNLNMVVLARESRGFTQEDLANRIKSHKAKVSRLEGGSTSIDDETLMLISAATNYPPHFFYQPGDILPVNLAYRKRQNVAAKLITPIEAQINILKKHTEFITKALKRNAPELPVYPVNEKNTPEKIAGLVRKKWEIDNAIIDDLTAIIEKQGLIIHSFAFGTERVDSRSMLTENKYPMIFINSNLLGDRQRYSLAYELGHLIMHTFTVVPYDRDINHEANLFAAEFLMPAREIIKDFKNDISLPLLGELKRKWKVSMIALLYRADDLGLLTPNQKKYLIQQFNQLKIRRREPQELDIPKEKPRLMRQLLAKYMTKTLTGPGKMSDMLAISPDDFIKYYGD